MQKRWLNTFNLKSLDEAYTPKLPQDLQEAIGKEIKLTKGSLYKIIEKGREQYIPQIKETLEKPDFALRDSDDMLIIAKEIGDKQYFTSINLETQDYFISISNAPKKENILKNKVENGAKVVYQSPNAKSIFYTDTLLQEGKSPTNKIDSEIIPQNHISTSQSEKQGSNSASLTKGETLPLNSSDIIPQQTLESTMQPTIPQQSTKLQSNAHLGSGLVGGSVAGIDSDENGNLTFSPEKFALGLLGGAIGSKVISSGYKRFLEKKPQRIIPFINKQKSIPPRFEVTKELEKTYRNAQVKPNEKIKDTLGLSGAIKGDFIKLAQKHPEYFANPQEAKDLCDYVFQNAFIGLQASDKKQALIIANLQDSSNDYGSVAFRVQNINGEHRIRSVILMEQKQVDLKIQKAKELGEPIFQFW